MFPVPSSRVCARPLSAGLGLLWLMAGASAQAPDLSYPAPLSGYQAYQPQAVGNWRAANEAVQQAGGWRAYGREAASAARAASQARGSQPGAAAAAKP